MAEKSIFLGCEVCGSVVEVDGPLHEVPRCCDEPMQQVTSIPEMELSEVLEQKWQCDECGYSISVPEPPSSCPNCSKSCVFRDTSEYVPTLSAREGERYTCQRCELQVTYVRDRGGVLSCCGMKMSGAFPGHD